MKLGIVLVVLAIGALFSAAAAHSQGAAREPRPAPLYSWERMPPDKSPVLVQAYTLQATSPKQADFLRRMHLENGVEVRGTHWIMPADARSQDIFILAVTQSMEGGFDSVNIYDRGVLSWGLMQWTARTGSLTEVLVFIKRRLCATHRRRLWTKIFAANGLDADANGLLAFGKRLQTPQQVRLAFRGTMKIGGCDPKIVNYWSTVMARAGRNPAVEALQVEYAGHIVDTVLAARLKGVPCRTPGRTGTTIADLAGSDPYTKALAFVLWTNNPRHALLYVGQAARAARSLSGGNDLSQWPPGAFSSALLRLCRESRFGNWSARASQIESRRAQAGCADGAGATPFEQRCLLALASQKAARAQLIASRGEYVRRSEGK